ncbi:MAG TPA: bifunctional diaminohydroxyphosphoribosylaminopyrimidine deaminase/5-amino-6-(5-phosphoribosylamino)uracil reductase RibD [Steroidobacteraceae bacterium]|nr:bifunctional diaminohydroxyphosphoribosylaminopyrimidine deaminase/5-amino-6-(5-phosphoribosylamino)uracil reductase RibD [Steroidobacteraceae bacterium]
MSAALPDEPFTELDRRAMTRALELAERGAETTHPNPRVGCVIVRGEQVIAEGWHERAGGPHAEVAALQALRASGSSSPADLADCTAYVTLEPCSHYGRTPPCVDALIAARIGRVVYAIDDPNPRVAGKGAAALRAAGVRVQSGLMAPEAEEMNLGYLKWKRTGRPFVRIKMGTSLDGRVALANGKSQWITSEAARADVQRWRARSSAVLTGIGTVLADDPRLNVRLPGTQRQPTRVVLDSDLRTPPTAQILDASAPTLIFTRDKSVPTGALAAKGVRIERIAEPIGEKTAAELGPSGGAPPRSRLDLHAVLARLGELDVNELLVEAGPTLSGAFVQQGLADELLLYMAPTFLGPHARALFELPPLEDLQRARRFRIIEQILIGDDLRVRLRPA